ncbi:DUF6257 family protein [Streptomyces prunicolor]|uniref:DUF6257 family protein n=1 Tax=Streptomyces prunicolor TaxID=67348 RepID=UPI000368A29E|nr:DUF6257 family protein [Streptomyces prunicolor]
MRSSYTRGEKLRLAWLVAKAAKQSMAGDRNVDTIDPRLKRKVDQIQERAAERGKAEFNALQGQLAKARREAAAAKVTMRTSKGPDRAAARRTMYEREGAARRLERELRTYQ